MRTNVCAFAVATVLACTTIAGAALPPRLRGVRSQAVELGADEYAFLLWKFGMAGFQPAI